MSPIGRSDILNLILSAGFVGWTQRPGRRRPTSTRSPSHEGKDDTVGEGDEIEGQGDLNPTEGARQMPEARAAQTDADRRRRSSTSQALERPMQGT